MDLSVNAEEKLKSRKAFDLINLTEEGRSGNTPAMNGIFVYSDVNSLRQVRKKKQKLLLLFISPLMMVSLPLII